jgi:hypothetical protein
MREIHYPLRYPRQAARHGGGPRFRHFNTTKNTRKIIITLLTTGMSTSSRTLAESPGSASARRAIHSETGTLYRHPAGFGKAPARRSLRHLEFKRLRRNPLVLGQDGVPCPPH